MKVVHVLVLTEWWSHFIKLICGYFKRADSSVLNSAPFPSRIYIQKTNFTEQSLEEFCACGMQIKAAFPRFSFLGNEAVGGIFPLVMLTAIWTLFWRRFLEACIRVIFQFRHGTLLEPKPLSYLCQAQHKHKCNICSWDTVIK